jgi:hypothetical protein
MKNKASLLLTGVFLASMVVNAQPQSQTFELGRILSPGMKIGDYTFTKSTTIHSVALTNSGDFAFSAVCDGVEAIFSLYDRVAQKGDVIDGKVILTIDPDSPVAINNKGQVGWIAWYATKREMAAGDKSFSRAVFVDHHLMLELYDESNEPFKLTDDGHILRFSEREETAPPIPAQKKQGLLGRLKITGPRLPGGAGVSMGSPNQTPGHSPAMKPRPPLEEDLLSGVPGNRTGQKAIVLNYPNGFLLLLATPASR